MEYIVHAITPNDDIELIDTVESLPEAIQIAEESLSTSGVVIFNTEGVMVGGWIGGRKVQSGGEFADFVVDYVTRV